MTIIFRRMVNEPTKLSAVDIETHEVIDTMDMIDDLGIELGDLTDDKVNQLIDGLNKVWKQINFSVEDVESAIDEAFKTTGMASVTTTTVPPPTIMPGDVVSFTPDGVKMTVTAIESADKVSCTWFDRSGHVRIMPFHPSLLTKVSFPHPLTSPLGQASVEENGKQTVGGKVSIDAATYRESLKNLRWEEEAATDGMDRFVLKADTAFSKEPVTLIICKKQDEGQWRTSFAQFAYPGVSGYN